MWKLKGEAPYPVEITSVEELQKNGYFMPWNTLTDQEKKMKKAYDDVMKKDLGPEHKKWEEDFKKIDEELVKVKEKKRRSKLQNTLWFVPSIKDASLSREGEAGGVELPEVHKTLQFLKSKTSISTQTQNT